MGSLEGLEIRNQSLTLAPIKVGSVVDNVEKEGEPLTPMARLFHKPDSNVYILAVLGLRYAIDPEHVKANMGDMVRAHPRFSCLQVVDEEKGGSAGMRWVKTQVNYDEHLIVPKIEATTIGNHVKYLEDYMYDLTKTTVDLSRPLWDVHIPNGLETSENSKAVVIIRIHHSIGDGMSLMSVLLTFSRKATDPNERPEMPVPSKKIIPVSITSWARCMSVCSLVWNTLVDVLVFLATIFYLNGLKNPLKGPPDVGYNPKRIVFKTVKLDDVKMVAKATNMTVNDVLMGLMESAISRYLSRKQVIASEELQAVKETDCPKSIKLKAVVFFNIRLLSGVHSIEEMMKEGSLTKWGNKVGYVLYPFNAMMRSNPLEYVYAAKAVMERKKASLELKFTYFFLKIMLKIIGIKALGFPSSPTFYFSSLMGPKEDISLFGYPIDYIVATCYNAPTALLIHVTTYANKLTFALSVDEDTIPHPHSLCDDLEESLKLLKQAVLAPSYSSPKSH